MAFQVSPGVVVKEIDLTTIVPAVSTTEAAIAGVFNWGPADDRTLVSSEDELVLRFGKPNANNYETFFVGADFLAYGSALYVSRAVDANTFNASAGNGAIANVQIKNFADFDVKSSSLSANAYYYAKWPGALGNSLKISVCDSTNAYSSPIASSNTSRGDADFIFTVGSTTATLNLTDIVSQNNAWAEAEANTMLSKLTIGDYIVAGNSSIGTQAIKVASIGAITSANGVATANITLSSRYTLSSNITMESVTRYWEHYNTVDLAPGTSSYVEERGGAGDQMHIVVIDEDGKFSGTAGNVLEVWENLSRATDALGEQGGSIYYKNVLKSGSGYIWANADRAGSTSNTASQITALNTKPYIASFANGTDSLSETSMPLLHTARAYDQFKSSEDVDVSLILTGKSVGGTHGEGVANYIIDNIVEYRKDCVAFISPALSDVVNTVASIEENLVEFRNALRSTSYAVLDSGYKYRYDRYNDVYRWTPLNGDIAGTLARTDNDRDPWWSPAGFNRGAIKNIVKLAFNPNKSQRDVLYKNGINPVVTFPGEGTVLYGDKTLLAKPSAFDRINVRRLFIVLEKAISVAAKYTLFEFNDMFTRARFRNMIEPYLRDVMGRRGITDFEVVCDETNNTPEVIDRNEFIGDIFIKPARSINFITLNFTAVRTGVEFQEVITTRQ